MPGSVVLGGHSTPAHGARERRAATNGPPNTLKLRLSPTRRPQLRSGHRMASGGARGPWMVHTSSHHVRCCDQHVPTSCSNPTSPFSLSPQPYQLSSLTLHPNQSLIPIRAS
eukprot:3860417-Prymnesium_polylepis.2